jgi:hypothetical protein
MSEILQHVDFQDLITHIFCMHKCSAAATCKPVQVTNVPWACSARRLQGFVMEKEEYLFLSQLSVAPFCDLQVG